MAFTIDAWWEERLEQNDEQEQLGRLLIEFEANFERIDNFGIIEGALSASLEVFDQIEVAQREGADTVDVSVDQIALLTIAPTYEADSPVLEGLIRSGRLEIIQSQGVIAALASWERTLRDYAEVALLARTNAEAVLIPGLVRRGDIGVALVRSARAPNGLDEAVSSKLAISIDTEIKGLIAQKISNTSHANRLLGDARAAAEGVVATLRAEIKD